MLACYFGFLDCFFGFLDCFGGRLADRVLDFSLGRGVAFGLAGGATSGTMGDDCNTAMPFPNAQTFGPRKHARIKNLRCYSTEYSACGSSVLLLRRINPSATATRRAAVSADRELGSSRFRHQVHQRQPANARSRNHTAQKLDHVEIGRSSRCWHVHHGQNGDLDHRSQSRSTHRRLGELSPAPASRREVFAKQISNCRLPKQRSRTVRTLTLFPSAPDRHGKCGRSPNSAVPSPQGCCAPKCGARRLAAYRLTEPLWSGHDACSGQPAASWGLEAVSVARPGKWEIHIGWETRAMSYCSSLPTQPQRRDARMQRYNSSI